MSDLKDKNAAPASTWWAENGNEFNRGRGPDFATREEARAATQEADKLFPKFRHWHTALAPDGQLTATLPKK